MSKNNTENQYGPDNGTFVNSQFSRNIRYAQKWKRSENELLFIQKKYNSEFGKIYDARTATTTPRICIFTLPRPKKRAFFERTPIIASKFLKNETRQQHPSFTIVNHISKKNEKRKWEKSDETKSLESCNKRIVQCRTWRN